MAGVLIRSNYQDIFDNLLPAIDTVYLQANELDETDAPWQQIFSMKKSKRQFENVTGVSGFGLFSSAGEATTIPLMDITQLYRKNFLHTKFAGAWQVSEEMEDDDQFEVVSSLARAFARSYRFTKEVNFANALNNAFSGGSERSADGVVPFTTHTMADGNTKNNSATSDMGVTALQAMFNHFATLTDDKGIRVKLQPAMIVAHPNMRWIIGEILRSEYKPQLSSVTAGTADQNAINVLSEETLKEVYWAELTDTNAWYVFAKPSAVNGLGWRGYDRQAFTTTTDFDVRNLTMISVGRGRWSRGCIDWRQGYASAGAS